MKRWAVRLMLIICMFAALGFATTACDPVDDDWDWPTGPGPLFP